ncbi:DUF956 family protein [Furfurilactobacillus siliginis]|uniref:DUF956 family protein n=1 Tax=Furfurilactobacillus siliginis TaxID=348151 RepID=A0A0R2L202_9LACO|nr:DUF956 family protein [Furfurilactobacillus siliginis]KRN95747.1 hypothetical protein IV55_GL001849 [Furfurilactobacillus siliginis]GEK27991.1 hypothetical protein LSI01_03020 [Furfurilactobacillus siliginis]
MVESLNSKVELVANATSYMSMSNYGKIMVGDAAFEFYNDRDTTKYVQIPWDEVTYVVAAVVFNGRWIPRFTLQTKHNGSYRFSSRKPKAVLRAIRNHVDPDHVVRALPLHKMIVRDVKNIVNRRATKKQG